MAEKKKKFFLLVTLHVVVWLLFLSLPALFNPHRNGYSIGEFASDIAQPPRAANGLLFILIYYFNYYIAIPRWYLQRRYPALILSFIGCFAAFFLLNYLLMPPEFNHHMDAGPMHDGHTGHRPMGVLGPSFNLFMFIIVYAVSFAVSIYELWQHTKQEVLQSEISFLKAQINPHFLFNALNSIYSLSLMKSDRTPDAVLKLAGMMRYSVTEAGMSHVSLAKELDYIHNYIELQKLRLDDRVKMRYEVKGRPEGKMIAPFLLTPFIENAFKHGVSPDSESELDIKIDIADTYIVLKVFNKKVYTRPDRDGISGLGINNTRKRLMVLYAGKHNLAIEDKVDSFDVSLKIDLL